ncbi:MAG: acyltransferase [Cytophagales bacterium]|nr:acyltransferase [Cytophagales bacterium]
MSRLVHKITIFLFRCKGILVDYSSYIHHSCQLINSLFHSKQGYISIGAASDLQKGVCINAFGGTITIGEHTFIGQYTVIYGHGNVTIGSNSLISMHCRILSSNHTIPDRQHIIRDMPDILLPVTIGNDVWLGAGVTVLGGVNIGHGCVVGAGAVVTKDLPDYSIAVGNPATIIRHRQ